MMLSNGPFSPQAITASLLANGQQMADPTSRLASAMMPGAGGAPGMAGVGLPRQGNGQLPQTGLTGAIAPGKYS